MKWKFWNRRGGTNAIIWASQWDSIDGANIVRRLNALEGALPKCKVCQQRFSRPELTRIVTEDDSQWGDRYYLICERCKGIKGKKDKAK